LQRLLEFQTTVSKVTADIATKIVEKAPCDSSFQAARRSMMQQKLTGRCHTNFHMQSELWTVHILQSGNPRSMEMII
jgi:predicted ABC-type ATPase